MRYSGKQIVHPGVRARDLPALMELYELNYIQLRRLLPDLERLGDHGRSRVAGALDLYLRVRERCRYTTTVHLSYRFEEEDGFSEAPDILVCMYHDAQVAEVIACGGRRHDSRYDRFRHQYSIETKWQMNRFLHKWLGYCLHHGHGFSVAREHLNEAIQAVEDDEALSLES